LYQTKSKGFGAAQIDYQAKGTEIDVSATDSLADIVSSINNATYAQGDEVVATILDNQLVLSRKATGAGNNLTAYDVSGNILNQLGVLSGTGFKNVMQTPTDAVFTVNNIQISRSQNTGLTDVIQGVTLNLATDAEGQSATLAVADDSTSETSVLNTFINKFNTVVSYLTSKTAVTKQSDGTYSRGALAGDSMFQSLRLALVQEVNGSAANSGIYKSLNDIGLSLDDNFSLSISDSTKLKEALSENKSDVMKLLDGVMSKMQTTLSNYVGNSGYVNTLSTSLSSQLDQTNNRITDMTKQLTAKQQALVNQYANIQSELQLMTYEEQEFETIYSTLTSTTTSA
jgi:flagellar hook-associated protein 2